jgi:hypothetical protein
MKIFLISSDIPFERHNVKGVTAIHVVTSELLHALLEQGHDIVLQIVFNTFRTTTSLNENEQRALDQLRLHGIKILPPIHSVDYLPPAKPIAIRGRLGRLLYGLRANLKTFYPAVNYAPQMGKRIRESGAEVILSIWCPEAVAVTYGEHDAPHIAFHGDIDFMIARARISDAELFGSSPRLRTSPTYRLRQLQHQRAHLEMMRDVNVIANVTAYNADYYRSHGHPCAVYIRNLWTDSGPEHAQRVIENAQQRARESTAPIKMRLSKSLGT